MLFLCRISRQIRHASIIQRGSKIVKRSGTAGKEIYKQSILSLFLRPHPVHCPGGCVMGDHWPEKFGSAVCPAYFFLLLPVFTVFLFVGIFLFCTHNNEV